MAGAVNDILSPDQEQAIIALLNEPTVNRAAAVAKVGERTLYRWLTEPMFAKAYREARREAFRHAIALTQKYTPAAVQTLMKVMADPAAAHSAKVSAAAVLLKFSRESIELDDLAARIEALEHVTGPAALPIRPSTPPSPALDQAA
jgi:uncharacterized protein YcaQ